VRLMVFWSLTPFASTRDAHTWQSITRHHNFTPHSGPSSGPRSALDLFQPYHDVFSVFHNGSRSHGAQVEDTLQRRIPNRPSRETLQAQNILKCATKILLSRPSLVELLFHVRSGISHLLGPFLFRSQSGFLGSCVVVCASLFRLKISPEMPPAHATASNDIGPGDPVQPGSSRACVAHRAPQ
jgi:hypothetical protein